MKSWKKLLIDDKVLEVVAVSGIGHLGKLIYWIMIISLNLKKNNIFRHD